MTQTATRRSNARKPTIYEALVSKLGRVPTASELKADVERIKREAYEMVAGKGKLPHQRKKRNPESASESMYSSFHGVPSTETLEYSQDLHYHGNLAALGELIELKVNLLSGDKAVLTFNASDGEQSANPGPYNKQGRAMSDSMRLKEFLKHTKGKARPEFKQFSHRGETIEGTAGKYFVPGDPRIFTSLDKAKESIDKKLAIREEMKQNPFWPFSSHSRTVIYHLGSGDEYKLSGTHKGYKIYKEPTGGFAVPKLDADSRFDTKKNAEKFIDSWKKVRPNPSGKKLGDQIMGEHIPMPGFPQIIVTRHFAYQWLKNLGWDERKKGYGELDYTVFQPKATTESLTDAATRDQHLNKLKDDYRRNPKHAHGPFHEAGKFISHGSKLASKPLDQFTDVVGKVGGYLDDRIGKALNPQHTYKTEVSFKKALAKATANGSLVHWYGTDHGWVIVTKKMLKGNPQVPSADSVMLTSNESGTQLYLVGGDQSLNLSDLGIKGPAAEKEHIVIGDVTHVVYRTRKDFDKLQETDYIHTLSEDSGGPLPELVYDRLNKRMSLVGGVYFIKQPLLQTSPGLED